MELLTRAKTCWSKQAQGIRHKTKHCQGTKDPRVEFCFYQVLTQMLIKFHPHNLDQASTSKSQPNISPSSKLKHPNLDLA